jgi:molecular chaperone GrpE (heat shock protein)
MYAQLIRPILLDIIAMRDSMLKQLSEHKRKPEGEQHIPLQMFETYAFDTEEILEKNSISIYKSDVDSDFVPIRQRAIKKVPTESQNLHGKVAESLGDGYSYLDKTISPEKVAVYVYEEKQEQSTENEGEATQNG